MKSVRYSVRIPDDWLPSKIWNMLREEWREGNQAWDEISAVGQHDIVKALLNEYDYGCPLYTEAVVDHYRDFVGVFNVWGFTDDEQLGIMVGKAMQKLVGYVGPLIGEVYDHYGPSRFG